MTFRIVMAMFVVKVDHPLCRDEVNARVIGNGTHLPPSPGQPITDHAKPTVVLCSATRPQFRATFPRSHGDAVWG